MHNSVLHESESNKSRKAYKGLTLIELLVVLAILSILAVSALPFAELTVRRSKELELRRALRDIRTAIDRVHEDWESERISRISGALSKDGFPKTLKVLVEGVPVGDAPGSKRKYLRRIPRDPFPQSTSSTGELWELRGYQQEFDSDAWNEEDVFDVRSTSDKVAIDGSRYKDW